MPGGVGEKTGVGVWVSGCVGDGDGVRVLVGKGVTVAVVVALGRGAGWEGAAWPVVQAASSRTRLIRVAGRDMRRV